MAKTYSYILWDTSTAANVFLRQQAVRLLKSNFLGSSGDWSSSELNYLETSLRRQLTNFLNKIS